MKKSLPAKRADASLQRFSCRREGSIMQPLISIIVPIHNSEQYLTECIQSVLAQTQESFELLLIDDGSSDGSRSICEKMQKEDPRLRYLPREHAGVAAARNAGLMAATGRYVFFLDSDDVIHPALLETLSHLLEKHDFAMATEEFLHLSPGTEPPKQWPISEADEDACTLLPSREALDCLISERPIKGLGGIGGQMIRRDRIGSNLFDTSLSRGEDTKLVYQLFSGGADLIVLHRKWYCYRAHAGQSSRLSASGAWKSAYECQIYIRDREAEAGRMKNALIREGMLLTAMAAWYAASRRDRDADRIEYLKRLMDKERKWEGFSQVAPRARISFFLVRYFPSLYLLAYRLRLSLEKI